MSKKSEKLFEEFPPVALEEWEKVIEKDLRGADYRKKLKWHTGEGIDVLPFYRKEILQQIERNGPLTKSQKDRRANAWEIREMVAENSIEAANKAARTAVDRGAQALQIILKVRRSEGMLGGDLQGVPIQSQKDFSDLVRKLPLGKVSLHFDGGLASPALLSMLWNELETQNVAPEEILSTFSYDPFLFLLENGCYPKPKENIHKDIIQMSSFSTEQFVGIRPLCADARFYHNAGGTIVQQLAFALASASEYLSILTEAGLKPDKAAASIGFSFAVGSSYFLEIAKFRSARILWSNLLEAYGADAEMAGLYLHGETSQWNKTLYDPYTNMLRTTTEAMSAAIGGCDAVTVHPFDYHLRKADDFSKRIARNQQLILREEAYFDQVADPAAGSYYIEKLTDDLGSEAWKLFQEVEAEGGLFKAIEHGIIQSSIQEVQQQRHKDIATRKHLFVGTNRFTNPDEESGEMEVTSKAAVSLKTTDKTYTQSENEGDKLVPFLCRAFSDGARLGDLTDHLFNYQKQHYRTVHPYRGAREFETLRRATEKHASTPLVLILPMGNRKMRKARATFASNFFGCAGFDIEEPLGFDSTKEAVSEIKEQKADIVVLCSSDKEYKELVPELGKQLKQLNKKPISVVAGDPKEQVEAFRKAGVDEFIHAGSNVLKTLTDFQKQLGILSKDS